jgi:hypothetical protein
VRITAGRRSLDACAGERTTLSAVVEDAAGFPVADGSELRWSTTAGQLSAPGIASGQALTTFTAAGATTVSFTAARPLGEATVAGVAASATAGLTLALTAGPPVAISLSADPKIVPPGGQSTIMAQVLDACALPVVDGTSVRLLAERGTFDDGGGTEAERRTREGKVSAALRVGVRSGPLRVTARVGPDSTLAEVQLDVRAPATPPPPPRWTIHLPFMRGGARPARAAGR